MSHAVLFPGQGAQYVGMSEQIVGRLPEAQAMFDRARELLDLDLLEVMTSGPEEQLNSTALSQPAIFVASVAALKLAERETPELLQEATATAGLSLGEYTALVFAGAIEFESALEIVVLRGRYMQEACEAHPSGMVSLLGINYEQAVKLVEACREAGVIAVANVNSPKQIVVSGEPAALDLARERAPEYGARRAVPLRVAGAYHSPLMNLATQKLEPELDRLEIRSPRLRFVANVTAEETDDPEAIRAGLKRQVESSVLWEPTLQTLFGWGIDRFVELGPGKVIQGLIRQTRPEAETVSLLSAESFQNYRQENR